MTREFREAGSPVPLVDLAPWFDGDHLDRAEVARTVDRALQTSGFLLIANHRVPPAALAAARQATRELFALPLPDKEALAVGSDAYRGWSALGTEATAASYGVTTLPDLRESFTIGPIDRPDDDYHRRGGAVFAPNRWPPSLPRFEDAWLTLYRSFEALAEVMLRVMEAALGLQPGELVDVCRRHTTQMVANYYPAGHGVAAEPGQYRVGPHTDFGTLTILDRQPGVGGLQVRVDDGTWADAPWIPGTLTVNTGDLMALWSGYRWTSTLHRVLPPSVAAPDEELLSLIFFHEPDHDAIIRALAAPDGETAPDTTVVASEYLRDKLDAMVLGPGAT
jgi:isopenicillin N synthase-like dioxygenase